MPTLPISAADPGVPCTVDRETGTRTRVRIDAGGRDPRPRLLQIGAPGAPPSAPSSERVAYQRISPALARVLVWGIGSCPAIRLVSGCLGRICKEEWKDAKHCAAAERWRD